MQNPTRARFLTALLRLRALESLRYREYRLLWSAQLFSGMGSWMDQVTRSWLIYELTDSAVQLGMVRGVQAIPYLLFSPFAGSAADRYSRRNQMLLAQGANALIYVATALLVLTGLIRPWHVYVTAFLTATCQVFQQPARSSMISDAVPREYLTNAIGLNSLVFNVTRGIGPALAGALIVVTGTGGTFGVQAILLLIACATTWPLNPVVHASHAARHSASFAHSILEGWKLSWQNQTVRAGILCVMLVSFFIIPFTTLLPVFARDLFAVGATGQGLMLTAMGAGAFFSAALVANAGHNMPRGAVMLVSGVLYGVSVMIFAAAPWYGLALAAMFAAGLFHVYSNALVQTVVQSYTPPEFRGRTMALFSMNQVALTVGAMVVGTLASIAGPRGAVALMGAGGAISIVALHIAMPKARHIR